MSEPERDPYGYWIKTRADAEAVLVRVHGPHDERPTWAEAVKALAVALRDVPE